MKPAINAASSVDEVQELIVRAEEILESLEKIGDARANRLRDRFRHSVVAARGRMLGAHEGLEGPPRSQSLNSRLVTPKQVALAALAGLTLGLLVALPALRPQ
jgi:ElaB/YqjD/DUF883 family membrane-anchored ribosome-binding protein